MKLSYGICGILFPSNQHPEINIAPLVPSYFGKLIAQFTYNDVKSFVNDSMNCIMRQLPSWPSAIDVGFHYSPQQKLRQAFHQRLLTFGRRQLRQLKIPYAATMHALKH